METPYFDKAKHQPRTQGQRLRNQLQIVRENAGAAIAPNVESKDKMVPQSIPRAGIQNPDAHIAPPATMVAMMQRRTRLL